MAEKVGSIECASDFHTSHEYDITASMHMKMGGPPAWLAHPDPTCSLFFTIFQLVSYRELSMITFVSIGTQ
jgi:hypothetical protein